MLTNTQIRFLKSAAHPLRPIVLIGAKGLTAAVDREINLALESHELIKIKLGNIDDASQQHMINHIQTQHKAHFVQKIGHTAIFFRQNPKDSQFKLPKN
ncbi:YhbY family RNA-binding protein [Rappaport israeli]|uniref:YhbY family RNA-binding protein n=1 Tax=Rappaport israeli TaxID=1839807 RepID=UPI0009900F26|nr:YhbY family RNA-binding protein [Rappaport israeli]